MTIQKFDPRLEDRAFLRFEYPDDSVRILPFYENPNIRERKRANYVSYNVISRPSELFAYTGAESRKFGVDFSITLPHILAAASYNYNSIFSHSKLSKVEKQQEFFKSVTVENSEGNVSVQDFIGPGGFEQQYKKYRDIVLEQLGVTEEEATKLSTAEFNLNLNELTFDGLNSLLIGNNTVDVFAGKRTRILSTSLKDYQILSRAVNVIMYWINILRSCTSNNVDNPLQGPPVVRLNHGILYQAVPCICDNVTIEYDEMAGFDSFTLLPRKLNITMSLAEFRAGDFTDYQVNTPVKRDNVVGWESVLGDPHSVDPLDVGTT